MDEYSFSSEKGETEDIINYEPIIIEQNEIKYILNIEDNGDKMTFSINDKEQFPSINYIRAMSLNDIKKLNKAFNVLKSFNDFYNYLKKLANNKKLNIIKSNDKTDKRKLIFDIEGLSKKQEIDLYPTKKDINLYIKEIYKELSNVKEKLKEIDYLKNENHNLKGKIDENTKEIIKLKNENQDLRKKLRNKISIIIILLKIIMSILTL